MSCFHFNVKGFDVQNFELVLPHKHKLAYFTLLARDERRKDQLKAVLKVV